jgi:hypothetical protein
MARATEPTPDQEAIAAAETLATGERPSPHRLADLAGGIGKKIETIAGQEVTVTAIEITIRDVRALENDRGVTPGTLEAKDVAIITVAPQPGFEDHGPERYYTFSGPLVGKLREIQPEDLPAVATFRKEKIAGGREAWTIS